MHGDNFEYTTPKKSAMKKMTFCLVKIRDDDVVNRAEGFKQESPTYCFIRGADHKVFCH